MSQTSPEWFECDGCGQDFLKDKAVECNLCNGGCAHTFCSRECRERWQDHQDCRAEWMADRELHPRPEDVERMG